jgi:hypothetical protein
LPEHVHTRRRPLLLPPSATTATLHRLPSPPSTASHRRRLSSHHGPLIAAARRDRPPCASCSLSPSVTPCRGPVHHRTLSHRGPPITVADKVGPSLAAACHPSTHRPLSSIGRVGPPRASRSPPPALHCSATLRCPLSVSDPSSSATAPRATASCRRPLLEHGSVLASFWDVAVLTIL